jgi:hypothetical protein
MFYLLALCQAPEVLSSPLRWMLPALPVCGPAPQKETPLSNNIR